MVALLARGHSLRGTEDCLALGFGEQGLCKSAIGERFGVACNAARALFGRHFAGRGQVGAADEVYLSGHPVLEMVEPYSLAITGLKPHCVPSKDAWEKFLDEFAHLQGVVSDEGRGLRAAIEGKFARQGLDQWHLTRPFSAAVQRLELAAYAAMEEVERCRARAMAEGPQPPGPAAPVSLLRIEQARQAMSKAIGVFDDAETVLGWLSEAADAVNGAGQVRTPGQVAEDWETALDLVDQIDAPALYAIADKLRGKRGGAHLHGLAESIAALPLPGGWKTPERNRLQELGCQAWRFHHRRKTHILAAPAEAAAWIAFQLGMPFVAVHLEHYTKGLFKVLDCALKSSSAVECANSILRLGEGGKRHPHPDCAYLLAWQHNTRRFKEGRRKGLSPAELLGVILPKDGWAMLLEEMNRQSPNASNLN